MLNSKILKHIDTIVAIKVILFVALLIYQKGKTISIESKLDRSGNELRKEF